MKAFEALVHNTLNNNGGELDLLKNHPPLHRPGQMSVQSNETSENHSDWRDRTEGRGGFKGHTTDCGAAAS